MYKYKVLVTENFKDKYTGKVYNVGEVIENLTEERVNEIKAVKNDLISVIIKEEVKTEKTTKTKAETETEKTE